MGKKRKALARQQEILADIAFNVGHRWVQAGREVTDRILDSLEGSRGLTGRMIEWAVEFDAAWEAGQADLNLENYIGEIDEFSDNKFKELVREHS
jgi:hypothetical protein